MANITCFTARRIEFPLKAALPGEAIQTANRWAGDQTLSELLSEVWDCIGPFPHRTSNLTVKTAEWSFNIGSLWERWYHPGPVAHLADLEVLSILVCSICERERVDNFVCFHWDLLYLNLLIYIHTPSYEQWNIYIHIYILARARYLIIVNLSTIP